MIKRELHKMIENGAIGIVGTLLGAWILAVSATSVKLMVDSAVQASTLTRIDSTVTQMASVIYAASPNWGVNPNIRFLKHDDQTLATTSPLTSKQ